MAFQVSSTLVITVVDRLLRSNLVTPDLGNSMVFSWRQNRLLWTQFTGLDGKDYRWVYQNGWHTVEEVPPVPKPQHPPGCAHDWVGYVGLTEKYDYCRTCDAKKETASG